MQKLKTRVIKKDVNPEWNEDLTLSITDPNVPITLVRFLFNFILISSLSLILFSLIFFSNDVPRIYSNAEIFNN